MRRILSLTLAFILIVSIFIPIENVYADDAYEEAGNILKELGILKGDASGNLNLNNPLKREEMVVMLSRLLGQEDEAANFNDPRTPNLFKDISKFYTPYIRWSVDRGLIKGVATDRFGFGQNVTVQQYQAVLLRALGYTEESNDWNNVPNHARQHNLMEGLSLSPSSYLTRGQMAVMTLNALRQEINRGLITLAESLGLVIPEPFKVVATVTVDNNTATFTGQAQGANNLFLHLKPASTTITTGDQIFNVILDADGKFNHKVENLQVGNYQFRFQSGTKYTDYELFTIKVLPFDLVDVTASNLKEITLSFTQPVDRTVASLVNNYTTTAGPIREVRFEDNDSKIVLVLAGNMTQQMKYKISAVKIKSKSGEEISIKDYEFLAFDSQVPTVTSITQLGTKGLRIYLSEPIKDSAAANFKINGRNFPGYVNLEYDTVTLNYFSSSYALSEGTHILTISGLEDFAGYKIIDENISINITKDTIGPSIVSATATLDQVIIEFDEDIDPVSANINNFYWKQQNNTKRYASKVTIKGNKAIVDFTTNKLTTAENIIYVENVVDYSNNKIKPSSVKVIPEIDTTPPEVIYYTVSDDGKTITVYFSKNVDGSSRSNYKIVDNSNRNVNIRDIQGSGSEYRINLYTSLPVGLNTLTIEGIKDTTPLKNSMIPFVTVIDMKDVEKPKLINYVGYGNNIILYFSKPMDMTTVTNHYNYIITYGGKQEYLPINTLFIPGTDGKSVNILLPEYHTDGKRIMIGTAGNLTAINVRGLKDLSGNDTDPVMIDIYFDSSSSGNAKAVDYDKERPGRQGVLIESNLIKVRFSMPIVQASAKDFSITGRTINSVIADGSDVVTIYLDDNMTNLPTNTITINQNNSMKTIIDTGVESGTIHILDKVAPKVKSNVTYLTVYGNMIELPFTEPLEEEGASLYRRDLEIIRLADNKILNKEEDYTTSLKSTDKSVLVITIKNREITSGYAIRLVGSSDSSTLSYIRDVDGNLALPSEEYFTEREISKN